ncbi:MAG: hypothetical protein OXP28_10480 [Gammaproteobacteria bacterium]|nr:hypothetical protein [Gammaproteobacteria bacterium]
MDRIGRGRARNAGTIRDGTPVTRLDAMSRFGLGAVVVALLAAADPSGNPAEVPAGNADSEAPPPMEKTPASEPAASEDAPSARARYNLGLEDLENGDFAGAAEAFLAARDDARGDPVLRYRSAFNLGLALAAQADGMDEQALEETIETLRSSAAWFSDAARLAPEEHEDARVNLEIVLRRIQQLADQLNRDGHLETRLDRIIDDQRGLRDQLRGLLADVESNAGAEFRHRFESLAASERALVAQTADIVDLAAEERAHLEGQGEDTLAPGDRARMYQLGHMDHYLERARQSMSDTRRRLRRLEGERGHRRADTALAELKRAREQLADPVTVLKAIASDETSLVAHAGALAGVSADDGPPPWLTVGHLTNRQEDAAARTGEMLRRLEATIASVPGSEPSPDPQTAPDAERARQAVSEALPHVEEALDAMRSALSAFGGGAVSDAAREGSRAVAALSRAIERFAGLRELIEIAYADQARAVAVLEADAAEVPANLGKRMVRAVVDDNHERLGRMEAMLRDTLAETSQEGDDGAAEERLELAEKLRMETLEALDAVSGALASGGEAGGPARLALERLEALRRLFFSIVEHLEELLAEQTDTHDQTATVQVEPDSEPLGFVAERQEAHAHKGAALGEALAAQTDAARAGEDAEAAENMAEATRELRAGTARMRSASETVASAAESAGNMSPYLEPALDDQVASLGHIESAIRLLRPPSEEDGESGGEQPQQEASAAAEPEEQMSRQQALQRLQAVRDREAERQRRRQREQQQAEPVEKDW